jgi:hypothetical protein
MEEEEEEEEEETEAAADLPLLLLPPATSPCPLSPRWLVPEREAAREAASATAGEG